MDLNNFINFKISDLYLIIIINYLIIYICKINKII